MKLTTSILGLLALTVAAPTATAQEEVLANPTLPDGSYIVKYDMENHKFCESNDFEIDETFVFAVDITGTSFVDGVNGASRNPAVIGRGIAHDFYANNDINQFEHFANSGNLDGRLFHIDGNIYGAMFNLLQLAQGRYKDTCFGWYMQGDDEFYDACEIGKTVTFGANIFPFGWSKDSRGAEWWDAICTPITTLWFTTAPYTGTKTSPVFYFDDYDYERGTAWPGCMDDEIDEKGYGLPSFYQPSGVTNVVTDDADNNAPVEYFNLQGMRVDNPVNGIFIIRQGGKVTKVKK